MSQIDYNIYKPKNKHITKDIRIQIETLIKGKKHTNREIYTLLVLAKSTYYDELKRGTKCIWKDGQDPKYIYSASYAHHKYKLARFKCRSIIKLDKCPKLKHFIAKSIKKDKWSPDAVIGYIKTNNIRFEQSVSTKTVYNAIHNKKLDDVNLFDLRRTVNRKPTVKNHSVKPVSKNKASRSIEKRPEIINNKERFGDWEIDCVVGKKEGKNPVLLTLAERQSNLNITIKMVEKTAENVVISLDKLKIACGDKLNSIFKSITSDNGSEFSDFIGMERPILESQSEIPVYFAHPYASSERGCNEHGNGMVRYFVPKGKDISKYSVEKIREIQDWLNNYPRKKLGYKTPKQMFMDELNNLGITLESIGNII